MMLTTADVQTMKSRLSNMEKIVEENAALRKHLEDRDKEIEELKEMLYRQPQQRPRNKQQTLENSTGSNPVYDTNNHTVQSCIWRLPWEALVT
ncbi:hypothetical protein INT43_008114 [Umbelopsis isabellina]|uniref:Uncharacterized protein n=1 Tax=Mortierella isabellina TaxID=91625 RepID=A0A8H7PD60_MORIS|nr:hypothetical protein INT43_008114 [Umbelopsis isabellina]